MEIKKIWDYLRKKEPAGVKIRKFKESKILLFKTREFSEFTPQN